MELKVQTAWLEKLALRALKNEFPVAGPNIKVRCFCNDYTPTGDDYIGDLVQATGGGYAEQTISSSTWAASVSSPFISLTCPTVEFTFTGIITDPDGAGAGSTNIYGIYLIDLDNNLVAVGRLSSYFTPDIGYRLQVDPTIQFSSTLGLQNVDITSAGGIILGGSSTVSSISLQVRSEVSSGGLIFGGSALFAPQGGPRSVSETGTGGILFGGTSTVTTYSAFSFTENFTNLDAWDTTVESYRSPTLSSGRLYFDTSGTGNRTAVYHAFGQTLTGTITISWDFQAPANSEEIVAQVVLGASGSTAMFDDAYLFSIINGNAYVRKYVNSAATNLNNQAYTVGTASKSYSAIINTTANTLTFKQGTTTIASYSGDTAFDNFTGIYLEGPDQTLAGYEFYFDNISVSA